MVNKSIVVFIALFVIISAGILVWAFNTPDDEPDASNTSGSYSTAEVAKHSTEDDCWTIIGGAVFNLTDYISDHPGGEELIRACGTDSTSLFLSRRTPEGEVVGSGTPHSQAAEQLLGQFHIGSIEN